MFFSRHPRESGDPSRHRAARWADQEMGPRLREDDVMFVAATANKWGGGPE